jgi:two-component system, NtrC family, C4-dicarboxylate transport response regulator DctD
MSDKSKPRLLIVEDDHLVRQSLAEWLHVVGMQVESAASADEAMTLVHTHMPELVLSDIRMPGRSGLELMQDLLALSPGLPVVLVTGHGDVPLAVQAMRDGAHDFLTKPYDPDHLLAVIRRGVASRRQQLELLALQHAAHNETDLFSTRMLGASPAMVALRRDLRRLASLPLDIVLYGETGSGKDVAAQALHAASARAKGPFVALNCAAIPVDLAEGELFGHEEGAFTGAKGARPGRFEAAQGGTLFLDEIESMPLALQAKVLRVVQERQVERLGSTRPRAIDLRIIAAAKVDLRIAAGQERFRSDLYYRLAQAELTIPPLRARESDALALFEFFAAAAAGAQGMPLLQLAPPDRDAILTHPWPGNVRELKLVAERFAFGLIAGSGGVAALLQNGEPAKNSPDLNQRLDRFERVLITQALDAANGSISEAALALGIPRRTLGDRMSRLGIKGAG